MKKLLIIFVCSSITILFFLGIYQEIPKQLEVVFVDVGQGDSIFITTASGTQVVIDGGAYPDIDVSLANYMSFYDRDIDLFVATHPDLDHIGGLTTLVQRYSFSVFLLPDSNSTSSAYQRLDSLERISATAGQVIQLDVDTTLEVLSPNTIFQSEDVNESSAVLRLQYGETSVLLTGDASKFNEYDMISVYGREIQSDILKLGHHGSYTSSSSLFIDVVRPDVAIASRGCDNRFGHPSKEVVKRLDERGIAMLDTCIAGDIVMTSDGVRWKIK